MKKAFSLSELLLALGIVAVISSLMITTVIPKGDEKKYETLANKAYLTLEEAYGVQIMNDSGRIVTSNNVLNWMVAGGALPVYDSGDNVAQLPNGMIIYNAGAFLYVDIDGVEGKTKTTLDNASELTDCAADVLRFRIHGSNISPDYNCGNAREYFEYNNTLY